MNGPEGIKELLRRYCTLQSLVVGLVYSHEYAGDCFCEQGGLSENWMSNHWRTDEEVIAFVEDAVVEAVAKRIGKSEEIVRGLLAQRRSMTEAAR